MIGTKVARMASDIRPVCQGRNHVFKVGVQFLGLGYCTEQNTDGRPIPSSVHCSLLRNGNHTLRQKFGVVRPNFWGVRTPDPQWLRPYCKLKIMVTVYTPHTICQFRPSRTSVSCRKVVVRHPYDSHSLLVWSYGGRWVRHTPSDWWNSGLNNTCVLVGYVAGVHGTCCEQS